MKKTLLNLVMLLTAFSATAQWIPVNNGLPDFPPTTIINWADTMVVSTFGGGIFKTYDFGENWSEMPGTLPNLFVNRIEYHGGQFDPISVSTEGGPFICVNGAFIDCNGTGLTNTSVNFWRGTFENWPLVGDAIVGTNGDGIFAAEYTSPFIYDWSQSNQGITGDGFIINDGLISETFAWLATDGGAYYALFGAAEWTAASDGLSGDALRINNITWMGFFVISTDGGLYYALNLTDPWQEVIGNEKFNTAFYIDTDLSSTGFICFAFGENGYSTEDFVTWTQMDFGGMDGEVTAAQADSVNLYIGFTVDKKNSRESGGLYKRPIEQFVVGIKHNSDHSSGFRLNQNYPNPFIGATRINYRIMKSDFVQLKILDYSGREITTLVNTFQQAGNYTIVFDGSDFSSGTYYYTLQTGNNLTETKMMIILK